jgi:hypothetical protein
MNRLLSLTIAALMLITPLSLDARKVKTKIEVEPTDTLQMERGTFIVSADACESCNNGYSLTQLLLTGYDKPLNSDTETFFVTNNTDCDLTTISIEIEYLTLDSRQLHKRFERIKCDIPAGETRKIDIRTWDRQHSFYYHLSTRPRRQATPYTISITPITITLRFP